MSNQEGSLEIGVKPNQIELAELQLENISKENFDQYAKDKITALEKKIESLATLSTKYNRYHYLLTLPQLVVNAAMTSSVLIQSSSDTDYKSVLASLGIFNAVLQSISTSLKYAQKSQKMLDKKKFCGKLKNELEMSILMTSITDEYKQDVIRKITQIGV